MLTKLTKLTKIQLRADMSKQKPNNTEQNYSRRFLLSGSRAA